MTDFPVRASVLCRCLSGYGPNVKSKPARAPDELAN